MTDTPKMRFNKVDRALEMQVIDWLQFGEFEESLIKNPDGSDMARLALELIDKRKKAFARLLEEAKKLKAAFLGLYDMDYSEDVDREIKRFDQALKEMGEE